MGYAMMEKKSSCSCDEAGGPKKLLPSLIRRQGRSSEVAEGKDSRFTLYVY